MFGCCSIQSAYVGPTLVFGNCSLLATLAIKVMRKIGTKFPEKFKYSWDWRFFDAKAKKQAAKRRWPPRPEMHRERMQQFTYYKHT